MPTLLLLSHPPSRPRGAPPPMSIQMELHKIIISEMQDQQIIVLKEVDGERKFPIVIGSNEAIAIDLRLKSILSPRPHTHFPLNNTIASLAATTTRPFINSSPHPTSIP